ncbi:MAG: hypothetical protein AABW64_01880 [Nanoarchaeota archaeon]
MANNTSFPIITVLTKKKYLALFFAVTILFFLFNLLMQNLRLLIGGITKYSWNSYIIIFANVFVGSLAMLPLHSRVLLVMISILVGVVLSLLVFKISVARKQAFIGTKSATLGAIFGLAVPACAACGIGLLSLIGLGSVLWYLPFKGTEVAVISVVFLSFAVYQLNNGLKECDVCQINLKRTKHKK